MRSMSTVFAVTTDAIATRRPKPVTPEAKYRRSASLRTAPMHPRNDWCLRGGALAAVNVLAVASGVCIYALNTVFIT